MFIVMLHQCCHWTHGHNIVKDALIGGTARKVVRKSKIPVGGIRLPGK